MTLAYHEQRQLQDVDRALCRSDPGLAAMLSMFAELSGPEQLPDREQLRVSRSWPLRLVRGAVRWLVSGAAFLMVCVAGGGFGASRRATGGVWLGVARWLRGTGPSAGRHSGGDAGRRHLLVVIPRHRK